MDYEAAVLGAGISGLVAAKLLLDSGCRTVLVIDEYNWLGGNHISCDFGPFTFDIGTLIFQDDSPLMQHFPELLALYHPISWSIERVIGNGSVRAYPISMSKEVWRAGPVETIRIFASIVWNRVRAREMTTADGYARYWMGSRLFERSGLSNYIKRFYGVEPRELDFAFAEKRMGWLRENGSVRKQLAKLLGRKQAWPDSRSFVRPRNGFENLYQAVRETLEARGVTFALGQKLNSAKRNAGAFQIWFRDDEAISVKRLVSTIPLDQAFALCGLGSGETLPYTRLTSLFFSFSGDRGFDSSILYNFSDSGDWKRLTMFSDFFGSVDGISYFGVEVTARKEGADILTICDAFQADVLQKGLFRGALQFVGSHRLEHAYPVYVQGAMERANTMIADLQAFGVESMGRQGGFDYLPTARQVTLAIEKAIQANA